MVAIKVKDLKSLLPRWSDDSGYDVRIQEDKSINKWPVPRNVRYNPKKYPALDELEVIAIKPGINRYGEFDATLTLITNTDLGNYKKYGGI